METKIPKLVIFVDKNSQNDQTPFPKVGRKTPEVSSKKTQDLLVRKTSHFLFSFFIMMVITCNVTVSVFTNCNCFWIHFKSAVKLSIGVTQSLM